jgi:hypothetical protein
MKDANGITKATFTTLMNAYSKTFSTYFHLQIEKTSKKLML